MDEIDEEWDNIVIDTIKKGFLDEPDAAWNVETLQTYFMIVKDLNPIVTENANAILQAYFNHELQKPARNAARTTARLLDSLIRYTIILN